MVVRLLLWIASVLVLVAGSVVLYQCIPGHDWSALDPSPASVGVALVVVSLSSMVALSTAQNWRKQRKDEAAARLRDERTKVYEQVIGNAIGAFKLVQLTDEQLAKERATIALWGSANVVDAFRNWFDFTTRIMSQQSGNLSAVDRLAAYDLIYACVRAARSEVGITDLPSKEQMMPMIFADYAASQSAAQSPPSAAL